MAATSRPKAKTSPASSRSPFAKRLLAAREKAGLRLDDASFLARVQLGGYGPSRETIRRYETAGEEDRVEPAIIVALAAVYGCKVKDLSPFVAATMESMQRLFNAMNPDGLKPAPPTSTKATFKSPADLSLARTQRYQRKAPPRSNSRWSSAVA